ncbi:MAG: zinc-dependent dehydrogenase [Chloroflexota bacterium]
MRTAVWYSNRDVRLEERPKPQIGPGEVLVRIEASGICGSDVMEWYRRGKAPLILGHEVAGTVAEVSDGVKDWKVGDRVVASHHVPCGRCHYCRTGHETACETLLSKTKFDPGGFCEFTRLFPINVEKGLFHLPDNLTYEEGTFAEPLGCVLRGQRRAGVKPGASVLIIGSGISGLLHIRLARATGAALIVATDVSDYRLNAAKRFGADAAVHARNYSPNVFRSANSGRLADIVIVCAGAVSAVEQALESVDRGGSVLFFAPTMPGETVPLSVINTFWRTDVTLTTSYAAAPADFVEALDLMKTGKVHLRDMITHRLGLAETDLGFKLVSDAGNSIKVIIEP